MAGAPPPNGAPAAAAGIAQRARLLRDLVSTSAEKALDVDDSRAPFDALLDTFLVLYQECSTSSLAKEPFGAEFLAACTSRALEARARLALIRLWRGR